MIVCGDAREKLDELYQEYGEFAHAVITSPPYWGLRDYSDAVECVFGRDEGCEHRWGATLPEHHPGQVPDTLSRHEALAKGQTKGAGRFCQICGAWRGQFGLEPTPEMYVEHTLEFLRAIRRVLRKDGTVWWNLGDSYASTSSCRITEGGGRAGLSYSGTPPHARANRLSGILKEKDLVMIPFRVALAAQADGWWVRSVIIWNKPNPMPESVRDRPTTSHEYVLLLTKSARYFYDADAIREPHKHGGDGLTKQERLENNPILATGVSPSAISQKGWTAMKGLESGRNKRTVWTIATQPYPEAHFATFPETLVEPMILTTPTKCCAECGAGWERMVERPQPPQDVFTESRGASGMAHQREWGDGTITRGSGQKYQNWLNSNPLKTLGFRPTCSCDAESKPAVVLDPFAGRGTVARVARKHNRDWVAIEMNPDYIPMMERYLAMADEEVENEGETWVQPRMDLTSLQK